MDDDHTTTTVGITVAVLAAVSVALRFYARCSTGAGLGWDDWRVLLGLLAAIATDALVQAARSANPNGPEVATDTDPTYTYTPADVLYIELYFIGTVLYFTITSTTKLSIVLMYGRLFSASTLFRRQLVALAAVVVGFWVGCTIADLLNCIPLEAAWDWTGDDGPDDEPDCFNYAVFWLASGVVEACIDVLIIAMPVRAVFGLQLTTSKKIAVAAMFLLGTLAIFSGIIKIVLSYAPGNREPSFGEIGLWTTVHCCTGIVCACLPICWPLFVRLAELSLGAWPALSWIRKHWYRFGGWSRMERGSGQRDTSSVGAM